MSYISDTRGIITASKLKDYLVCEKLYKVKRLDESIISEEIPDRATLGDAFHYLVEVGIDKRSERYQITEKFLKSDLIDLIVNREKEEDREEKRKQLSKPTVLLPHLRQEFYGQEEWNKMQGKIELTPAESNMMLGMYEAIYKQPLRDMSGTYTKEKRFSVKYGSLNIGFKPDRICFYIGGNQVLVDEIDKKKSEITNEERKIFVKENNVTCLIRDYKSVGQLDKMINELKFENETSTGYVLSMAFYYSCIYAIYGVQSDVYIDAIEKSEPYRSTVISIPRQRMQEKLVGVIKPGLDRLIKCSASNTRQEPTRDELLENKKLSSFYKYFANSIQEKPMIIDLLV